jgi:hypothetical protein
MFYIRREYTIRDPHHDGTGEWGFQGGKLYHRVINGRWTEVQRVKFTPARFRAIASILPPEEPTL